MNSRDKLPTHDLRLQLRDREGAVLRTIGLMERRGFRLLSCTVDEADAEGQAMEARVASDRDPALLQRQLERLHDVLRVRLMPVSVPSTEFASDASAARPVDERP
jgi:acetolactate synthase regulatory subunit